VKTVRKKEGLKERSLGKLHSSSCGLLGDSKKRICKEKELLKYTRWRERRGITPSGPSKDAEKVRDVKKAREWPLKKKCLSEKFVAKRET